MLFMWDWVFFNLIYVFEYFLLYIQRLIRDVCDPCFKIVGWARTQGMEKEYNR